MHSIDHHITAFKMKVRDWFLKYAESPHMRGWLAFFSFIEAIFFPLPPDMLLIPILTANGKRWIYYATLTTATSVIGGIVGYFIGLFLFETIGKIIVNAYHLQDEMKRVGELFAENAFWAIFISGFSPIPYKLFTLSAGFFNISLVTFVFASIVGRAARFYLVSFLTYKFGSRLGNLVFTYFNATTLVAALVIILILVIWNLM